MYPNLNAELARHELGIEDIKTLLKCSKTAARDKLSLESRMKLSEAKAIRRAFFPDSTIDYLFYTKEPE